MLNGNVVVIASAHKNNWSLLVTFLVFGLFVFLSAPRGQTSYQKIRINNHIFFVDIADSEQTREQGLSGHSGLPPSGGMLFTYDVPDAACFWMKDMRFDLDIVWFDSSNKLIYLQQNLSPHTYPTTYCPPQKAQNIIELKAGTISRLGIKQGMNLSLQKQ